jgi:hypothetical protein
MNRHDEKVKLEEERKEANSLSRGSIAEETANRRICLRRTFSETVAYGHCASHFGLRPARDEISVL